MNEDRLVVSVEPWEKLDTALHVMDGPTIERVKRPDGARGFVVIARHWQGTGLSSAHLPGWEDVVAWPRTVGGNHRIFQGMAPHRLHPAHNQACRKNLQSMTVDFESDSE